MKEAFERSCIDCGVTNCRINDKAFPEFCPTKNTITKKDIENVKELYTEEENKRVSAAAAEVEFEGYCRLTRIEEIMEFAQKIEAHKLGIATCVGLIHESRILAKILRHNGFEVYGIACKAGCISKSELGIPLECESLSKNACNPIMQAKLLNRAQTDLNIVVGLCVGHDSLFYKYSDALVTTAITKDRVLGHNPAAALYNADSYYNKKFFPEQP